MSNWTSITPTAVRTAKNTAILDQVQSLASERGEADPLPTIVATVVSRIRAAVSAGNQLDADATKIPNSLEGLALGMIVRKLKDYLEIEQTKFESDQAADDRSYLNRIVDARAVSAARDGFAVFQQGGAVAVLIHELREQADFRKFFFREGQPAFEFGVQFGFVLQTHRRMKQRTGRRNNEPFVADGFHRRS